MFSQISSLTRSGMIALIALSVMPVEVPAAPIGPVVPAIADGNAMKPIQVQGEGRDSSASGAYRWKRKFEEPRGVRRDRAMRDTRPKKRRQHRDVQRDRWPGNNGPVIILQF